MSDTVPTFSIGETVRVMDTDWAKGCGYPYLANQVGDIRKLITDLTFPACYVMIEGLGTFCIPNSALMKYTPPGVLIGKLRVAMVRIGKENGLDLLNDDGKSTDMFLCDALRELWQIINS